MCRHTEAVICSATSADDVVTNKDYPFSSAERLLASLPPCNSINYCNDDGEMMVESTLLSFDSFGKDPEGDVASHQCSPLGSPHSSSPPPWQLLPLQLSHSETPVELELASPIVSPFLSSLYAWCYTNVKTLKDHLTRYHRHYDGVYQEANAVLDGH
ncbi:hypothetical protein TcWFU_004846 [Taenia crassiceps]|uniref:Uncharacterized protein n=1 Tax=Taenia crassiceps TaxID=6207 RepID=A0ABR4Q3M2_9CEST